MDVSKIGNYNLKDQQARENINIINTQLNNLKNERYILVGDSYSLYRPETNDIKGWSYHLKNLLGLNDNDCIRVTQNGGGFVNGGFLSAIQNASVNNPETITKIVVCGGANDVNNGGYSQNDITGAMHTFINYCNTTFPNAKVYVGMIGNWKDYADRLGKEYILKNTLPAYKKCVVYKGIYLNGVENIMNNYDNYYDSNHPNETGCQELAKGIFNALMTGYSNTNYDFKDHVALSNSPFSDTTELPFSEMLQNNKIVLQYNYPNYATPQYTLKTPLSSDILVLGNMNFRYIKQRFIHQGIANIPCYVKYSDDTGDIATACMYIQENNEVYMWVQHPNRGTKTITKINFYPFHIELDPIYY